LKKLPKIINKINTAISLASLPQVLSKLIEICMDETQTEKDIARIALLDPAVSLKLLRLSMIGESEKQGIRNLEQAVTKLGPKTIKNFAVNASVNPALNRMLRNKLLNFNYFWLHSLQCAIISRKLAERVHYDFPDDCYLAGLLHDIGKLVLWANFSRDYAPIMDGAYRSEEVLIAEKRKIGVTHCEVGWSLISPTGVPSFVADAILYHHWPAREIVNAFPLVRIVYAANMICSRPSETSAVIEILNEIGFDPNPLDHKHLTQEVEKETNAIIRSLDLSTEDFSDVSEIEAPEKSPSINEMLPEVREMSLIHSTVVNLASALGRDAIQKELLINLQIHFDIKYAFFFYYDPSKNVLLGKSTGNLKMNDRIDGIELPVQIDGSFPALAFLNQKIVDSFGYLTDELLTIADEQLIHLLNTEGLLCIPLISRQKQVGVIVAGIDEPQFPLLSEQLALLKGFADHAALFLGQNFSAETRKVEIDRYVDRIEIDPIRQVIHEVKNPLGIIKNYLKVLGLKLGDDSAATDEIAVIHEEIERVSRIIEQLSITGRMQGQHNELVDINSIIVNLSEMFKKSVLNPSNISLSLTLEPSLPLFPGNKNSLIQVLINLVKNSVEAMPGGGKVFIETVYEKHADENLEGDIVITVQDDGPGIPDYIMERLFEPGHSSKGPENFGLGLSISKDIISRYKGTITCKSRKRKGTTFKISLPVSDHKA
jgi:signal transduction histidine kinase/HD-like signal output (HDOD) protein